MHAAMRPPRLRTSSDDSWAAATAAAMTFLVSVALDLASGASVEHVVALGTLAAAAGALRLHRIGREHRWGARSAGAIVLAQPGLHIAGTTWDRWSTDLRPGHTAVQLGLLVVFIVICGAAWTAASRRRLIRRPLGQDLRPPRTAAELLLRCRRRWLLAVLMLPTLC